MNNQRKEEAVETNPTEDSALTKKSDIEHIRDYFKSIGRDLTAEPLNLTLKVTKVLPGDIKSFDEATNRISSSGVMIQGTADAISERINNIEQVIYGDVDPQQGNQINAVRKELESIRNELLPQLQESRNSLEKVEGFLKENATFLINVTSANGRLQALEGFASSLSKRLEFLEERKNTGWSRFINIITILISLISISIAIYVASKP